MSYRKYVTIALVLVALSGLVYGCGSNTVATTDNGAPLVAPLNLTATVVSNGIFLSWDANTQLNLRGYNVYRLDRYNNTIGRLNAGILSNNSYLDATAVPHATYEYRVTSVSRKNAESGYAAVLVTNQTGPGKPGPEING